MLENLLLFVLVMSVAQAIVSASWSGRVCWLTVAVCVLAGLVRLFYRERQEILIDRAKRAMLYGEKDV
jgi:hypothetical protein